MGTIDFKLLQKLAGVLLFFVVSFSFTNDKVAGGDVPSRIKITFKNRVGDKGIVLHDSLYTNPFDETYTITKLRYYITNFSVVKSDLKTFEEKKSYHLIDESIEASQSFSFDIPAGSYKSVQFLLGVDSLHNVSGAQTGDLDPTKDMFWTWNSGYVMAKMEGNSPSSQVVNNKFEYHIGGYSGPLHVIKSIQLDFGGGNDLKVEAGRTIEIIIDANISSWWKGTSDVKIAEHPVITTPGKMARAISDNYEKMFSIEKIISK